MFIKKSNHQIHFKWMYFASILILFTLQQVSSLKLNVQANDDGYQRSNKTNLFQIRVQGTQSYSKDIKENIGRFIQQQDVQILQNYTSIPKVQPNEDIDQRLLQSKPKELEKRDNNCHFSCSSCLDDQYYSCITCFGNRQMKYTVNQEVSMCKCGINSVDEGPGMCSGSSNKNLELAIKALFSSAFGVNLFTSFVVWNPMYFLGFTEFSQVISQLAYVNKFNVLNFDEISDFLTYSHIDKIFELHSASSSKIGRNDNVVGPSDVQQNPKAFINEKDLSFFVNGFSLIILHGIAWLISIFGRNNIKYKHLLSISTPLVIYLITFCDINFLALFQFSTLQFDTPTNTFGFLSALFSIAYIFAFTAYIFYYISIKQVLNEQKQTSQLKIYINELQQLILNNPDYDDGYGDDASSKQSHKTNSKINQGKQQNGYSHAKDNNDPHSMILQNLDNSNSHNKDNSPSASKDNSPSQNKDNSPSQNKDNSPSQNRDNSLSNQKNDRFPNPKPIDAESTYCDNESPIKQRRMQFMQELNQKNKSSTDLMGNNKEEEDLKIITLNKPEDNNSKAMNDGQDGKNEIRSIEEGLESNKNMRLREEELKLKLIEQEFILQQYRSKFYFFFVLLKQSNVWQRGFYTALILRKFFFGIINIYVFDDPKTQMIFLLLVNTTYFAFCCFSRPFSWRLHNIFFFFFESIALLCYIIFITIASEETEISAQITAIKAILSLFILAFIVYILIGLAGVIIFILGLIKGPKDPISEEEEGLKDAENKKSHHDEEEDDYSMEKKKEKVKQNVEDENEQNQSPQQKYGVTRNDSPPILQQEENTMSPYKNKLIKPFKNESIVLLEADEEEDDEDYNINKKVTNQINGVNNQQNGVIKPFIIPPSKPEEDERPDDHIRRPIKYQLTQIRKQAEELYNQQKQQFERNRGNRIAKTMILESAASNRLAMTEYDNLQDQLHKNGAFRHYGNSNNNNLNMSQGNIDRSGINILNRKQFDEEMSFNKNPISQPYSFRQGDLSHMQLRDGGDMTGRRILEDHMFKSQRTSRLDDDYNNPSIIVSQPQTVKDILNSHREDVYQQYSHRAPKKGILNLNRSILQNQQISLQRNNNDVQTDSLIKNSQRASEYSTPNNITPRDQGQQEESDLSERYSSIIKDKEFQAQSSNQKKLTFSPIKIESFGSKTINANTVENPSIITNLKGDEDNLEQSKPLSQKFQFKLARSLLSSEKIDKSDNQNSSNNELNKEKSSIFTKPFTKAESRFTDSSKNLDEIDSPVKINNRLNLLKNNEEAQQVSQLSQNSLSGSNLPQTQDHHQSKSQNDQGRLKQTPIVSIAEVPNNQDEQKVINLSDDDEDDDITHNIHNESYIPYDHDLKQYEMQDMPQRQSKGKRFQSLILNNKSRQNSKLNNTQIESNKSVIIDEKINEEENYQQDEDFNNKKQTPGQPFQ